MEATDLERDGQDIKQTLIRSSSSMPNPEIVLKNLVQLSIHIQIFHSFLGEAFPTWRIAMQYPMGLERTNEQERHQSFLQIKPVEIWTSSTNLT
jgi:hypothetical protein